MSTSTKTRWKPATMTAKPARKAPRKRPAPVKPAEKSWDYSSVWQPIGGGFSGLSTTYDSFGSEGVPGPAELISAFTSTVYACSTLIADSLAEIDIRLCSETRAGQSPPANAPKMWRRPRHRSKGVELHEIANHPALEPLYRPNEHLSYADLIQATSIYLDIIGRAFWLVTPDPVGLPARLDILPSHLVTTQRDDLGRVTGYWVGQVDKPDEEPTYRPDQVLAFRHHEYLDVNQEGIGPVRAVWQELSLSRAELSSWETIVKTMAHPSVSFTPKNPDAPMAPESVERFVKEYQGRLSRGNQGGPLFLNEAVDMNVLSFPPKDTAGLQLQDDLKSKVCNAFRVPTDRQVFKTVPAELKPLQIQPDCTASRSFRNLPVSRTLLDMQDSNFAGSKAGERAFQLFCLKPRISYLLERISKRVVAKFDDRLFLEHSNFVNRDEQLDLQRQTTAITAYTAGLIQKNEARAVFDLAPDPAGNSYYVAPVPTLPGLGYGGGDDQADDQSKIKAADPAKKYDKYPLKPVVEVLKKWYGKQAEYVTARTSSKAWASKSWIDLSGFSKDMAHDLRPALQVWYEGAAKGLMSRLGLTDEVWRVVQPGLADAVNKACYQLAESTNRTTSLAIHEAREKLKQELAEGMTTGDTVQELTRRVQAIFDQATEERAWLVADTTRTASISAAELTTAKSSGVVKAKVWLADSQACPKCKAVNGVAKQLDEPFQIDPRDGHFAVRQGPPLHCGCRCGMTWQTTED